MSESVRIIISGDVKGKLGILYKRITNIEKKSGKFDMLVCVGDFFGESCDLDKFASGAAKAPVDTFVVGPVSEAGRGFVSDVDGCALAPNVTYLGRRGVFSGSSGLRLAYLSGLAPATKRHWPPATGGGGNAVLASRRLAESDVAAVLDAAGGGTDGVDLLITAQWPAGVERWTRAADDGPGSLAFGSALVSRLARDLAPRYHLAATHSRHLERAPYRNHTVLQEKYRHVTRFVGLAEVKNPDNKQYLFALKLTPMVHMDRQELVAQPSDVTANPYTEGHAAKVREEPKEEPEETQATEIVEGREMEVQTDQYFFDIPQSMLKRRAGKRKLLEAKNVRIEKKPRQSAPCWFCLGNPQVERHLVVSIGVQVYLAMPRGPLVPGHLLVIPVGHHQSWVVCPEGVQDEIEEYKRSIRKYYKSKGLAMVVFERNFKSFHMQLQVVPVPVATAAECRKAFLHFAAMQEPPLDLRPLPKRAVLSEISPENKPYFLVELPAGERLFAPIEKAHFQKIDLQLGRAALSSATVLACPHRVDWTDCKESKEEETAQVAELRKEFAPFDFN